MFFLIFVMSFTAVSQNQNDTARTDSMSKPLRSLQFELFRNNMDLALPPTPELNPETFPAYLRQSFATPLPTLPWQLEEQIGFQGIWKQELARKNEYRTLKTILGTMQTGAAAYFVYKRLKKYGLK